MKCPRQTAFISELDHLLSAYYDSMKQRFSMDEQDKYIDIFSQKKETFCEFMVSNYEGI